MKMKLAYNASILRFRPYRDIGEFVNIGVLFCCPQIGQMAFRMERKRSRITSFFPEVQAPFLDNVLDLPQKLFPKDFEKDFKKTPHEAFVFDFVVKDAMETFRHFTNMREGILIFSPQMSGMTEDPWHEPDRLFEYYVQRNFPREEDSKEARLAKAFRQTLQEFHLAKKFRNASIGDVTCKLRIPFFHDRIAIKTVSFDHSITKNYENVDHIGSKLARLKRSDQLPKHLIFPFELPKKAAEAKNVVAEWKSVLSAYPEIQTMPVSEKYRIVSLVTPYIS